MLLDPVRLRLRLVEDLDQGVHGASLRHRVGLGAELQVRIFAGHVRPLIPPASGDAFEPVRLVDDPPERADVVVAGDPVPHRFGRFCHGGRISPSATGFETTASEGSVGGRVLWRPVDRPPRDLLYTRRPRPDIYSISTSQAKEASR